MTTTERRERRILARYPNGNCVVSLYDDGTKVKFTSADEFRAEFPDSIDLKITDYCDMNCPFCHEDSSPDGGHGDLDEPFLDTLREGTELAIGGGNPLAHPELVSFLGRMKSRGVICNLTVNEEHFLRSRDFLQELLERGLIWGLGISLVRGDGQTVEFASRNSTVVLHAICGMIEGSLIAKLSDKKLKLLLLGYKKRGRGDKAYSLAVEQKISWLRGAIRSLAPRFAALCFDNLALEQLKLREQVPPELFESRYMGDDGSGSMYIDSVKREFAVSSVSAERFPLLGSADDMFRYLQKTK